MPIRRIALAGMVAAFGAAGWLMMEHGPQTVANATSQVASVAQTETMKAIIAKKGLSAEDQEALMGKFRAQYPKIAQTINGWTPVTAEKIEALHDAYRALAPAERQAIAQEVNAWQQQVLQKYPRLQETWKTGGNARERSLAETAIQLSAAERAQLDTSTAGLWNRIATRNPGWASQVEAIMSAK